MRFAQAFVSVAAMQLMARHSRLAGADPKIVWRDHPP
jgi:hypothetical protein